MTTKLTKAEVKALPVCKGCKKPPTNSSYKDGNVGCVDGECWMSGWWPPAQWRLLMTPEAKGEILGHYAECFGCGWRSSTMATNAEAVAVGMEHQRTCPQWHSLKNEIGSLQSKLAKSEDTNLMRVGQIEALREQVKKAEQQLAEATKPVGDGDLEKSLDYLAGTSGSVEWIHHRNAIIRAARQRKPSRDVVNALNRVRQTAKSYLRVEVSSKANAVQRMSYRNDLRVAINIADSILAQAKSAAEDSADFIVDQPYHVDPMWQIGLGTATPTVADYSEGTARGFYGNFINFDAKRILNDTDHHEPEIRWTTPEEMKDVERRRKSPKVIFSGIDATQYDFHKAEQAVRAILGDFQLVLESFTFLPRKEHEPHADAYDSVPAADLLTAEERKFLEALRHIFTEGDKDKSDINAFTIIDRLAPAPSAATLTGEKP